MGAIPSISDTQVYLVLLIALVISKVIPCMTWLASFTRHPVDPIVVLRSHVSTTGPSPGRYMISLGPRIKAAPTEMSYHNVVIIQISTNT